MSPIAFGLGSSRAFGIARSSVGLPYWLQSINLNFSSSQIDAYYVQDIAKDSSGNIYVLGNSSYDRSLSSYSVVVKFNELGVVQWTSRIPNNASSIVHWGTNLHVTPDGSTVYVIGETYNSASSGTSFDVLIVKITTSNISPPGQTGSTIPLEVYKMYLTDGSSNEQEDNVLSVVDSSGNIYIAYNHFGDNGTFTDIILTKCSISSNTLNVSWSKIITASAGASNQFVNGIHLDSSENIYWSGSTDGQTIPIIGKHNKANGNLTWCKQIQITDYVPYTSPLHIDSNDNIYLTGFSGRIATSNYGLSLTKINSSASLVWQRILQSPTFNSSEIITGARVTTDTSNNVYILGQTNVNTAGGYDVFLGKFDSSNGNLLFGRSFGGSLDDFSSGFNGNTPAYKIIADPDSLIFAGILGNIVPFQPEQTCGLLCKLPVNGSKTGVYTAQLSNVSLGSPPTNYSITYNTFSWGTNGDFTSSTTISDFGITLLNATQTTASISESGLNFPINTLKTTV
jgi:hypothetical protein